MAREGFLTIELEESLSEQKIEELKAAIRLLRGVVEVRSGHRTKMFERMPEAGDDSARA